MKTETLISIIVFTLVTLSVFATICGVYWFMMWPEFESALIRLTWFGYATIAGALCALIVYMLNSNKG